MALGWLKALQLGYTLYKTGSQISPLLRRHAPRAGGDLNQAVNDLAASVQQLALAVEENRRMLKMVRAATIGTAAVSVITLILIIAHIAHA